MEQVKSGSLSSQPSTKLTLSVARDPCQIASTAHWQRLRRHLVQIDGGFLIMASCVSSWLWVFLCIGAHGQRIPVFPVRRNVSALYVLGDSSIDCGSNTLFYSRLHRNLSLVPCNGVDGNLLPHVLGTAFCLLLSFLVSFS